MAASPRLGASSSPKLAAAAGSPKLVAASSPKLVAASSPKLAAASSPKLAATSSPRLTAAAPEALPTAGSPRAVAPGSPKLESKTSPKLAPKQDAPASRRASKASQKVGAGREALQEPAELKPATVGREDNLQYCIKHLAAFDISPLHPKTNLKEYTRDSVQLLMNHVFQQEGRQDTDEGPTLQLPQEEGFKLPRMRPVPKVKEKTRFQKFMEERNMKKEKRSRMVYDEVSGDWKPRWGKDSIKKNQDATQWAIEAKPGEDSEANPFEKKNTEKQLLKMKQKMREVRNKVEGLGGKLNASTPDLARGGVKRGKEGLKESLKRAQTASASLGKFDRRAPNEATNVQQKRQKVSHQKAGDEKERYLKAAGRVLASDGSVDKAKAAKVGSAEGANAARGSKKGEKKAKHNARRSKNGGNRKK